MAHGQSKKLEIGISGGAGLKRTLTNSPFGVKQNVASFGFRIGALAEFHLFSSASIIMDLGFQRKGYTHQVQFTDEFGTSTETGNINYNFNYLTIPILARKYFAKDRLFINVGPYFGLLLKHVIVQPKIGNSQGLKIDRTDFFRRPDFGLALGIGTKLPLTEKVSLSFEIQNNTSVSNALKLNLLDGIWNDQPALRMFSLNLIIGISYQF